MVFVSSIFIFVFLPVLLAVYYFANEKYRNLILLLASFYFYAWGEPKKIIVMIGSIICNYFLGLLVASEKKMLKKITLIVAVLFNLGILFVFKYLGFTTYIANTWFKIPITVREIALPIGISFYTFQILSYIIDVYYGRAEKQKNLLSLALYVSLFPQLIAGPIVRYVDVQKQITHRTVTIEKAREGVVRFATGFAKKALIADRLGPLIDMLFDAGAYPSVYAKWIGVIAYTLQVYYDFSGYSDMAIGLGKLFGFDFLENFNYPYISTSVKEFWGRWHISLGSWFRDYLYIPLGGNRKGKIRTCVNLAIVFLVTGIWHGAGTTFVFWGIYYAFFIVLERVWLGDILKKLPKFITHIYLMLVVMIGWVFFRASSMTSALSYLKGMFVPAGNDYVNFIVATNKKYFFIMAVGIFLCIPFKFLRPKSTAGKLIHDIIILCLFVLGLAYMTSSGYSPFLYFRF